MPRQTFISKEFFLNASEKNTRLTLLSLPQVIEDVKFIRESNVLHSMRFLYQNTNNKKNYQVDVSLLPLNDNYTHVTLHVSHTNGQVFNNDNFIKYALVNFENAVHAAINHDLSLYAPRTDEKKSNKLRYIINSLGLSMNGFILKRK